MINYINRGCPCCGSCRMPSAVSGTKYIDGRPYHRIACPDCGASTPFLDGDCGPSFWIGTTQSHTDLEAWNRGPIVPMAVAA